MSSVTQTDSDSEKDRESRMVSISDVTENYDIANEFIILKDASL